jgi:signal transduction histidine kinase
MKRVICLVFLVLFSNYLFSQNDNKIKEINSIYDNAIEVLEISVDSAFGMGNKILNLSQSINYEIGEAKGLRIIGKSYQVIGTFSQSFDKLKNSLNIFEKNNDKPMIISLLRDLGELNRAMTKYDDALQYLNRSYFLAIEQKDTLQIIRALNRFSAVYGEKQDFALMGNYIDQTIDMMNQSKGSNLPAAFISGTYNLKAGTFHINKKYDSAFYYYNLGLKIAEENNAVYEVLTVIRNLSILFLDKGNTKKALELSKYGYNVAKQNSFPLYVAIFAGLAGDFSYKIGNYKDASDYYITRTLYHDSIYSPIKITETQIQNKQLIFDLLKNEKESKEQQLNYSRIIFSLIIFFIFLGAVAGIWFFKANNKMLNITNKNLVEKNSIIEEQNEKLQDLNATKDKFFSIIAHDLKNPISAYKLSSSYIVDNFKDLTNDEIFELIYESNISAKTLYKLLEDLLTWARSQSGKLGFFPESCKISNLVDNNISLMRNNALQKNIELINLSDDSSECFIDVYQIDTVVRNIISNAIKFTNPGGKIKITSFQPESEGFIGLQITDSGIGMSKDQIQRLFKIDNSNLSQGTAGESGTGLGLILCKEFIEKNQGSIIVESEINIGTSFKILLPKSNN